MAGRVFFPWLERISLFQVWEMNAMKPREGGNDVFSDVDEGNGDGDLVDSGMGDECNESSGRGR